MYKINEKKKKNGIQCGIKIALIKNIWKTVFALS